MIYKGVKILEQRVRYEIWDDNECIQSTRPEFVAYLLEDADDGLMYDELDEAKEAIDRARQNRLAKSSKKVISEMENRSHGAKHRGERKRRDLGPWRLDSLPNAFTSRQFAERNNLPMWEVDKPLRLLLDQGKIVRAGTQGRKFLWAATSPESAMAVGGRTTRSRQVRHERFQRWADLLPASFTHWEAETAFGLDPAKTRYRLRQLRTAKLVDRVGYSWYRTDR